MTAGSLITLGGNLEDPRNAKASDFPAVGPMGAAGMAEGAGKLVMQTPTQMGPMHTQDKGDQTPSVWGSDGGFTVSKSKSRSTDVKCDWAVDLESGQTIPNAMMDDKY